MHGNLVCRGMLIVKKKAKIAPALSGEMRCTSLLHVDVFEMVCGEIEM